MKKLNCILLSSILHSKVYDEYGDCIGKLSDIYVTTETGYPKAIGYKIKRNREVLNYEFRNIEFIENRGKVTVKIKGGSEIIPRTYSYLLSRHLLDKEIIDINGKKLVRVNDLRMAEIAGEIRVIAVDTGIEALSRRFKLYSLLKLLYKLSGKTTAGSIIVWDNVESLEMTSKNNLQLQSPYAKLSKLHPADLADILEDMDSSYRNKILESLDDNLASDTLEEIEGEVQADIIQTMSATKTIEVLQNMPNDEIADILGELDEETAERILTGLDEDNAEEVRNLMKYEDQTAGSIMNTDYIYFNINISAGETIDLLRELKPDDEVAYYIYIVNEEQVLQGVVSLRNLVVSKPENKLKEIMDNNVIKVRVNENLDGVVDLALKYNLISIPVVDEQDKLLGIVIINDILDEVLVPNWKNKSKRTS